MHTVYLFLRGYEASAGVLFGEQDDDGPLMVALLRLSVGAGAEVPGGFLGLARLARMVDLYAIDDSVASALESHALRRLTIETAGEFLSAVMATPGAGVSIQGGVGGPLARAERAAHELAARRFGQFSAAERYLQVQETALIAVIDDNELEVRSVATPRVPLVARAASFQKLCDADIRVSLARHFADRMDTRSLFPPVICNTKQFASELGSGRQRRGNF